MKLTYPMIIHNDSDGIWAEFPDLPGCFTDGDNLTELMENASDAIRCHLTDYVKEEIKIPAASRLECPSYRAKHVSRFGNGRL